MKNPVNLRGGLFQWLALSFLVLSLLVAVGVRIRLLDFPLERDEGCFAYVGQLILEGVPPYQNVSDFKMPGLYLAYAAIMSVFGQTPAGIHLGLLLVNLATLAVLFMLARKFLDLQGAIIATAAYALMTLSPSLLGLAAHATHFVMLPALLGTWLLFRIVNRGLFVCFASGCFFGVAFLMKQPGLFFGIFGGLYLAWISFAGNITRPQVLARLGFYSLGCLLPFLAVCLWLKIAGVFPQFWFWTITYPREYADVVPFNYGLHILNLSFTKIFLAAPLLWIIAGLGLVSLCFKRQTMDTRIFMAGFLVFSFGAVCPGLYFRPHYFIVLLPAIALLGGLFVMWSSRWLAEKKGPPPLRHLPFMLAAAACLQSLYSDRAVFFSLSPKDACRAVYLSNPFPEAVDIAHYLEQNTSKDQLIAVVGSEPEIYFYAHRRASTSFVYTYPLVEANPYAVKMQEDMIHDIEANPPEYLVFVLMRTSWLEAPGSSHLLEDWVKNYVTKNMQPVGVIKITGPQTTETVWGTPATVTSVPPPYSIVVFKRLAAR
jgi:hypothetical protein